jgi:hypothetical protein
VETVLCIVVTGLMLAAALSAVAASRVGQYRITERQRGELLAQELMAEIVAQRYKESDEDANLGTDSGEAGGARATWDDVDDYRAWSASPPQEKDGADILDLNGWTRSSTVVWANPADMTQQAGSDTGVKRITVTVSHNGTPVATLTALRTSAR